MDTEIFYIFARSIDLIGKLMVSFTAIMVHHRFLKEHKVDGRVFKTMRREQLVGVAGIALMIIAYMMEAVSVAINGVL